MLVEIAHGRETRFTDCIQRDEKGKLVPVDQVVLFDEEASAAQACIENYGPRSVALYVGTAGYRKIFNLSMAMQFMGLIGADMIFSTMAIDQSAPWVADGMMGIFATGKPSIQDCDVILLTGTNSLVSHSSPYQATPSVHKV